MEEHAHSHTHAHEQSNPEETLALLKYMAEHNAHHANELHELAHGISGEEEKIIHEAVQKLQESTLLLKKAIEALEG